MGIRRRRLVVFLLLGIAAAACKEKEQPSQGLAGSGVSAKDTRDVAPFTRISVRSRIEAEITIGVPSRLELEGDKNLVPLVTSRSENGTLTLDTKERVKPSMALRARISVARLDSVHVTHAASVDIKGLAADKFEARLERAGRVSAQGSAQTLVVDGKEAGAFDFRKVSASSATVRLERASNGELGYLEKLDVTLSGAAMLQYEGTPEIKKDIRHPARLIRRDQ